MISVEEALDRILAGLGGPMPAEEVALTAGLGRILAEDVTAALTQPPVAVSAMDGYAVRAADVAKVPARLTVIGIAPAGRPFKGIVGPGQAVRAQAPGIGLAGICDRYQLLCLSLALTRSSSRRMPRPRGTRSPSAKRRGRAASSARRGWISRPGRSASWPVSG